MFIINNMSNIMLMSAYNLSPVNQPIRQRPETERQTDRETN